MVFVSYQHVYWRVLWVCMFNWISFVLQGADEKDKKRLLSQLSINYDTLPQIFCKGSLLLWVSSPIGRSVDVIHEDLTGESFWMKHPDILESTRSRRIQLRGAASSMKKFKHETKCLPETWIVVHLDVQNFHRYNIWMEGAETILLQSEPLIRMVGSLEYTNNTLNPKGIAHGNVMLRFLWGVL